MGLDLTAHKYNSETKIYEFAPIENFGKNILFDDDVPTFKITSRIHHLLIAMVGFDYQKQTYHEGMYDFTEDIASFTHFRLQRNRVNYEDYGVSLNVYDAVLDFFKVCVDNKFHLSVH